MISGIFRDGFSKSSIYFKFFIFTVHLFDLKHSIHLLLFTPISDRKKRVVSIIEFLCGQSIKVVLLAHLANASHFLVISSMVRCQTESLAKTRRSNVT